MTLLKTPIPLSAMSHDKDDSGRNHFTEKYSHASSNKKESLSQIIEASVSKPLSDYKILVVEDNNELRDYIHHQLKNYFDVSVAENGKIGIEKIKREQPDIIVCDAAMPEIDGFELTRYIKNDFETNHIPVILLTAYSTNEYQLKGIQSGADAYICKPFSMQYLFVRIVKLIELREKLQQKFTNSTDYISLPINHTDRDKEFLNKLHNIIEINLKNTFFSVDDIMKVFDMNRTNFFKKVKELTSYSPNAYLIIIRLKKSTELLAKTDLSMAQIAKMIGFSDPLYFSKSFKSHFEMSPSDYRKKYRNKVD